MNQVLFERLGSMLLASGTAARVSNVRMGLDGTSAPPRPNAQEGTRTRLERLKQAYDKGLLSEEEYRRQRAKILDSM